MKSLAIKNEPELPPPPYIWLITSLLLVVKLKTRKEKTSTYTFLIIPILGDNKLTGQWILKKGF